MMRFFEAMAGSQGTMVAPQDALPGRDEPMPVSERHLVLGNPMTPPFPDGFEQAVFGMGCFWGAERIFWQLDGVWTTAVGYAGGYSPNPTYEEACSERTGHMEAVIVVFDPATISDSPVEENGGKPIGIEHVFINGAHVADAGLAAPTLRAGRVLRT